MFKVRQEHLDEAKRIGDDSWDLNNFLQLSRTATVKEQVEALKADRQWIEDKLNEVSRQIDYLIKDIEHAHWLSNLDWSSLSPDY